MEAASRPALEPLADLPVEEALGAPAVPPPLVPPPPSRSATSKRPSDLEEELLAHGALLDLGPEAPNPASPAAAQNNVAAPGIPGHGSRPDSTTSVPSVDGHLAVPANSTLAPTLSDE